MKHTGSPAANLLIWAGTGFYTVILALIYAELSTIITVSGGDYTYVYTILGKIPGFLVFWGHCFQSIAGTNAVVGRTIGEYFLQLFDCNCQMTIVLLIGIFSLCDTNILSKGFEGTSTEPSILCLSVVDGYFAYKGWESVATMPEEMLNPKRDLPLAIVISLSLVTIVYTFVNAAYLTILTPSEIINSSAVAMTFMDKAISGVSWFICISVVLSCLGTLNSSYLADSSNPSSMLPGFLMYLAAIPIYILGERVSKLKFVQVCIDKITVFLQCILLLVPTSPGEKDDINSMNKCAENSKIAYNQQSLYYRGRAVTISSNQSEASFLQSN
ncbi:DgyrCDS13303 [Dimorphilus gyrociliatus]|uniref:DgyrCDS13303 n=1 Tax=Dimorphilus gyrociliatus TaxID=2664684 RepID=A0A7I8WA88_9ANNE|nr:DgyrCDS13303 [Dimorphilus gyrociliatus]